MNHLQRLLVTQIPQAVADSQQLICHLTVEITVQDSGCGARIFAPFGNDLAGEENRDVSQVGLWVLIIDDPLDGLFVFGICGTPQQRHNDPLDTPINQILQTVEYFLIDQWSHNLPEHVNAFTEPDHHISWDQGLRHLRLGDPALLPDREAVSPSPSVTYEQHIFVSAGRDQPQARARTLEQCIQRNRSGVTKDCRSGQQVLNFQVQAAGGLRQGVKETTREIIGRGRSLSP